jgi:predicted nuclease of predicted toxin-antitoxin system
MRFLIDNALSPLVADGLRLAGYDTVHVRDHEMQSASDVDILLRARDENRIIVSADTDFGSLLTLRTESKPSFILFRGSATRRPERQIQVLLENLPALTEMLEKGCIAVLNQSRIRIRNLPIGD